MASGGRDPAQCRESLRGALQPPRRAAPRAPREDPPMDCVRTRFWQVPERLTPRPARLTLGLASAVLALAFFALLAGEIQGAPRLLSAAVLVFTGLGNLTWALDS